MYVAAYIQQKQAAGGENEEEEDAGVGIPLDEMMDDLVLGMYAHMLSVCACACMMYIHVFNRASYMRKFIHT